MAFDMTSIRNFKHLLEYAVLTAPDTDFMRWKKDGGIVSKTYTELKRDSDAFSRMLIEKGLQGAHIAIVGPASYQWVVAFLGTVNSGSIAVPLSPSERDEMNAELARFADCSAFCFDHKHTALAETVLGGIREKKLAVSLDNTANGDASNIGDICRTFAGDYTGEPDPDALCAIMFTSGTTGFPKGVMLTHKNFIWTGTSVHAFYPTQKMLGCLPFHHAFGLTGDITKTLVNTRTLCMTTDMREIYDDLKLYKPNGILAVPQIVKHLFAGAFRYAAENNERMSENEAVREFFGGEMVDICSGGAPLEAAVNDRFNATGINVFNGYGMTECSPIIANNVESAYRHGSVGKPIPCMSVRLSDGEILLKGPNIMRGYYKNEQATKEAFTEDGWLRTGDLGRMDEDGFLYITGRLKNLILLDNGENVSAEFLEEKLSREPLVKECMCFGDKGAIYAEILPDKAYAAEKGITDYNKAFPLLLQRVNRELASFQHISGYTLRQLPFERTASGKMKRSFSHGEIRRETVAPTTPDEKKVHDAVCSLLELSDVSMTDNFFAVGGDSLNAVELALTLNVKPQTIYDHAFLNDLAAALKAESEISEAGESNVNELIRETVTDETAEPYHTALLTGATGFLGIHILERLLSAGLRVYCLVRNPEKLKRQLSTYFGSLESENILPVKGDVEKPDLGLGKADREKLLREVDTVFHTAANVHHAGDYADLERTNVFGTENVIRFCMESGAVLQHTSTVSVHGSATVIQKTEKAVFDENILHIGQHYTDNVYIHSKYCAEEKVLAARRKGLKANIYRIGNLTWRRKDGVYQVNSEDNGFLHRIRAILKLGVVHENMEKYPMDLTAVDECADAYVRLALSGRLNRIWHMYDPNFLDEREMFTLLGRPYRYVSTAETIELCTANSDDRDIHVYMFYMIISGRSSEVEMRCDETVKDLAREGFVWGKPDRAYLTVSPDGGKGHCLGFEERQLKGVRNSGGTLTPIGKLTLGVLADAKPKKSKLITGAGSLAKLRQEICERGIKNPLFITVPFRMESMEKLFSSLDRPPVIFDRIDAEPTVSNTDEALNTYLDNGCDAVVAIGGGSVLDTGKITALRAANPDSFIADICKLDSEAEQAVPLFAVPTTAGTGSEATLFAVATEEDKNKKRPFTSDKFLPDVVILDPVLTLSVPKMSTAFTGIDALSHAVESYLSLFAPTFKEDAEMAPGVCKAIFEHLPEAFEKPDSLPAREAMQLAAYRAGVAFGRIGTGYIHAIAHRFGEFYHIPHGLAIAAAFTEVLRAYLPYTADKLCALCEFCGFADKSKDKNENAEIFIRAIDRLIASFGIDFSSIGFRKEDIPEIARKAQEEAKLVGYPRAFSDKQVQALVRKIMKLPV